MSHIHMRGEDGGGETWEEGEVLQAEEDEQEEQSHAHGRGRRKAVFISLIHLFILFPPAARYKRYFHVEKADVRLVL